MVYKGKMNGNDPLLADGIYGLIRTGGNERGGAHTIGVAPKHDERFAYFRLLQEQDLNEMANLMVGCANGDRAWTS